MLLLAKSRDNQQTLCSHKPKPVSLLFYHIQKNPKKTKKTKTHKLDSKGPENPGGILSSLRGSAFKQTPPLTRPIFL